MVTHRGGYGLFISCSLEWFRRCGGEQAPVERLGDGGRPVADAELGVDVEQVGLDRGLGDEQPGGCFPVGGPGRYQLKDLEFAG